MKESTKILVKEIGRIVLFVTALFFLFDSWGNRSQYFQVFTSLGMSNIFWLHTSFIFFSIASIINMWSPVMEWIRELKSTSNKSKKTTQNDEGYELTVNLLLSRTDNLDRVIGYLRSGVSISLAFFSAMLLWFLDQSTRRVISGEELVFLYGIFGFVVTNILAILRSFSIIRVSSNEFTLEEDLVPKGHSKEVYIKQLKEMISQKKDVILWVKYSVGFGLFWMLISPSAYLIRWYIFYPWVDLPFLAIWIIVSLICVSTAYFFFILFAVRSLGFKALFAD